MEDSTGFTDLFSNHAVEYKHCRPVYPSSLFSFLAKQVAQHKAVWDCGTGNGQGAKELAKHFLQVYATDASCQQIEQAEPVKNIDYRVACAEKSGLPDDSVSLITVFQAVHWFDLQRFYQEVKRVLVPEGVIAIIGYNTAITGIQTVDDFYQSFCFDYLWQKDCWAMERKVLNSGYQDLFFPFEALSYPHFSIEMHWTYHEYLAYLNTWSAVKTHIRLYDENPIETVVQPKIQSLWPEKEKKRLVRFPLHLRLGRFFS